MSHLLAYPHEYHLIPPGVREAIDSFVRDGYSPGSFTRAMLENNLFEAIGRADYDSMAALPAICGYVYNEVPSLCWGSPEKVQAWIVAHEQKRQEAK